MLQWYVFNNNTNHGTVVAARSAEEAIRKLLPVSAKMEQPKNAPPGVWGRSQLFITQSGDQWNHAHLTASRHKSKVHLSQEPKRYRKRNHYSNRV